MAVKGYLMHYKKVILAWVLVSAAAVAGAGDFGVDVDVYTTGLFPPRLETVTVASVKPNSSAAREGIVPGDKVVAIDDCTIPGCSAWHARKKMKKKSGESADFTIIDSQGQQRDVTLVAH